MNPNNMPHRTNIHRKVPIVADEITRLADRIDTLEEQLRDTRDLLERHRTWTSEAMHALLELIDAVVVTDE